MELTVKASLRSEVADDVAVFHPDAMAALDLVDRDPVRLATDERTVLARARAGPSGTTATDELRLPRSIRRSLGVGVDETVSVDAIDPVAADRVTVSLPPSAAADVASTVENALVDRVLVAGQTLTVGEEAAAGAGHTADSSHGVRVHVVETEPDRPVVVRDWTTVRRSGSSAEESRATGPPTGPSEDPPGGFDEIGGLGPVVDQLRELVELPLANPEVFRSLAIDPPRGLLLYGPPGTGKTHLVRALAAEAGVSLVTVRGSDVVSRGSSEENPFEAALAEAEANTPAIAFFDDLDALTGELGGEPSHRRVARLGSALDDTDPRSRIAVVGATASLETLDPSLRRAGRFDRAIEVPVPDRDGRLEILEVHTTDVPLADDVDLHRLAEHTHGFVGADLERLIRESAVRALRRNGIEPERTGVLVDDATLAALEVSARDVDGALRSVDPSALREVFVEVPDVSWDDVGGLEETTRRLRETVQWPLEYPDAFDRVSLQPATGVLLYGPPGTGKTLLAKVVANEAASNFISIKGPELLEKYVGESERGIREVFEKARVNAPTVVFFDEIDAIAAERGGASADAGVGERVVSQLLTELDGLEALEDVVVIATTNRPDLLDDALMRPGRFDRHIHVGVPDEAARRQIFAVHTGDRPLADDVDLDALAERTAGYVGADVEAVCREAATAAVREFVDGDGTDPDAISLTAAHFDAAIEAVDRRDGADGRFAEPATEADGPSVE